MENTMENNLEKIKKETQEKLENIGQNIDTQKIKDFVTNTDTNMGDVERIVSAAAGGALLIYGVSRKDTLGAILGLVGGIFAARGAVGHCMAYDAMGVDNSDKKINLQKKLSGKINVKKAVTIDKSAEELYKFWRDFENLPKFMNHLESVTKKDNLYSHWKAKAPLGYSVEWDAEITNEVENRLIEWKSLEGADIPNSGKVEFNPTSDRGTEVTVTINYDAPGGKLGSLFAKVFGEAPSQQVAEDLRRFKRLMEAGMNIKVEGQPSGRAEQAKKATA